MDCKVYFMDFKAPISSLLATIEVLEASVPTFPIDPFGQVNTKKRGFLKLRGPLMSRSKGNTHYRFFVNGGGRYVTLLSAPDPLPDYDSLTPPVYLNEQGEPYEGLANDTGSELVLGTIYPDAWEDMESNSKNGGPVSVLRITENYGLLLVPTEWAELGERVFKRIGLFEIRGIEKQGLDEACKVETLTII